MSQFKIIAGDQKEYGPVSVEDIGQWIQQGRANGETRVQREGETDWVPLRDVPELAILLGTPTAVAPSALPAAGVSGADDPPLPADLERRDFDLWGAGCFERGWHLFKANMGGSIGITAAAMGLALVVVFIGMIPFVGIIGSIAQFICQPVIMGGLWYFFIKTNRGAPAEVGDLFSGFSRNFGGLFLVNFISSLIIFGVMIPGLAVLAFGVAEPIISAFRDNSDPDFSGLNILLIALGFVLIMIPTMYLSVCWSFALPLAMDRRMEFWPAMKTSRAVVNKHWFQVFFFMVLGGMIYSVGILLCCVGLLFTVPITFFIWAAAYEHLFGERTASATRAEQAPAQP